MNKKISKAKKKWWKEKSKKERSAYASRIAKIKNGKMTKKEKSEHAKMMLDKRYHANTVVVA